MFGKIYAEGFSLKGERMRNQDRFVMHNSTCITDCYVEQSIVANDELIYYVVADGVGGLARGGEAATMAANGIVEWFNNYENWKKEHMASFDEFIRQGFEMVNQIVVRESDKTMERLGTTLTTLVIKNNYYYCANVGDSPVYVSNRDGFRLLADCSGMKDGRALCSYIGNKLKSGSEMVHIKKGMCAEGSIFIVCTDGLDVQDNDQIKEWLLSKEQQSLHHLHSTLNEKVLNDNCTVVKVVLARLNTTLLEDAIERCESDEDYANVFLKKADRFFERWDELIEKRTNTYSTAEFVEMVSADWNINQRTVRNWLGGNIPSRDNVLKICASLNYSINTANTMLEKDAHYSRLDPSNSIDYAWCRLLDSDKKKEGTLLQQYNQYLEEAQDILIAKDCGYNYIECAELIKRYMKEENINVSNAWDEHDKAKKAYWYISGKRKKGQFLPRYFLVAFSLHMNLTLSGLNHILETAGMKRLRSKNLFEASLIYTLTKLEIENPELFSDLEAYDYRSEDKGDNELSEIVVQCLKNISREITESMKADYDACYEELISYI